MPTYLTNIRRGAAVLAAAFILLAPPSGFVALAQVAPPAPAAAALSEPAIKALQDALAKQGIAVKVDGVLSEETRAAIRRYQSQHHLPVTGEPDNATLDKLGVRLGTAPGQATVAQAAPAEGSSAHAHASPQTPASPGPGGMMMSGPMTHGMMQGMMQSMQGMMAMMHGQMQPGQTQSAPPRPPQAQGGMMMNCPMMSGAGQGAAPAMMQMMQGMMQMMQAMQTQMQPGPTQPSPVQPGQMQPGPMQGGPMQPGRN
jgi:peptidoglycan hydrolase-like protein with peptidoglycan-binding domain